MTAEAESYGEKFDWEKPEKPFAGIDSCKSWLEEHDNNFYGLLGLATAQLKESQPEESLKTIEAFEKLLRDNTREPAAELLKGKAYRELEQLENETAALEKVLTLEASEIDTCMRLLQIYSDAKDTKNVKRMARLLQAINPLLKSSHRTLAKVAEKENDDQLVIESLSALATMNPLDRADTHYRLAAAQFRQQDSESAKRNVLLALEAAPRFRDAHRLLLDIIKSKPEKNQNEETQP